MPTRRARHLDRQTLFFAALKLARETQQGYALSVGTSRMQLHRILTGKAHNPRISAQIDAFIRRHFPEQAA